jgi:hypothetical protein
VASGPTRWSAQLDYRTITVLTVEQQEEIATALPDGATVTFDSAMKRLVCVFALEATSARRATDHALRTGHRAVPHGAEAVGVRVLPAAEQQAETDGNPSGVTVVGTVEAAALLGVSRHRLAELADTHTEFPSPLATLTIGRVWTRAAIESFTRHWHDGQAGRADASRASSEGHPAR